MAKNVQKFVVVMICDNGVAKHEYFVSNLKWVRVKENTWRSAEFSFYDGSAFFFDDTKQAEEVAHELLLQQPWNKFVVRPVKI